MFRRFDAVIDYPLPTADVAKAVIRNRLANVRLGRIAWGDIATAAKGLSHAEITLASERAAKEAILAKHDAVTTAGLVVALRERQARPRRNVRSR